MSSDQPECGLVPLLTIAEASKILGMSPKTLRVYMNSGAIKHIAFGHGL